MNLDRGDEPTVLTAVMSMRYNTDDRESADHAVRMFQELKYKPDFDYQR